MEKTNKFILYFSFSLYLFLGFVSISSGATPTCQDKYLNSTGRCAADCTSLGSDYQIDSSPGLCGTGYFCCHQTASTSGGASALELQVPLFDYAQAANLPEYIFNIYRYATIIIIPLAILMIIIGGIMWISAAGDKGKITNAKKYIINAFIGLGIALFSYILLSLVGINSLIMPGLQKIEPIIVNSETTDQPCDENHPTDPRCQPPAQSSRSIFQDVFVHSAEAKANVPLLKQTAYASTNYGACGTISTSGCGITSLTMLLQFFGNRVTVPEVAKMAIDMEARDCPAVLPSSCKTDTTNLKNNCRCCGGTRYNAFLSTADSALMAKYKNKVNNIKNYTSQILSKYGLKGDSVNYNDKKKILTYLSAQIPLIVSVKGPSRFTSGGHFIVLTGCDNCISALDASGKNLTDIKQTIYVNDPYNNITTTTTGEVLPLIQAAFYIHK